MSVKILFNFFKKISNENVQFYIIYHFNQIKLDQTCPSFLIGASSTSIGLSPPVPGQTSALCLLVHWPPLMLPLVPLLISSGYGPGKSIYYHPCNQYFYVIIKQPIYQPFKKNHLFTTYFGLEILLPITIYRETFFKCILVSLIICNLICMVKTFDFSFTTYFFYS